LKPDINASNCSETRLEIRYSVTRLPLCQLTAKLYCSHPLDVVLLVVLGDLDITSAFLQVYRDDFSKVLLGDRERVLDDIGDVVLQHPRQTSVKSGVDTLEILERDLLLEDLLVERDDEVRVEETTVENTEANTSTNEFEVVQVLRVDTGVRVDLKGVVVVCRVLEETVEGVEHLVREEEEEFSEGSSVQS